MTTITIYDISEVNKLLLSRSSCTSQVAAPKNDLLGLSGVSEASTAPSSQLADDLFNPRTETSNFGDFTAAFGESDSNR